MGPFLLWLVYAWLSYREIVRLNLVLFVFKLDYNLLFVIKLTNELNCITKFSPNLSAFQVFNSVKMIGNVKMSVGLYSRSENVQGR